MGKGPTRLGSKALSAAISAVLFALAPGSCYPALAASVAAGAATQAGSSPAPVPVPGQLGAAPGLSNGALQLALPAATLSGALPSVQQLSPLLPSKGAAVSIGATVQPAQAAAAARAPQADKLLPSTPVLPAAAAAQAPQTPYAKASARGQAAALSLPKAAVEVGQVSQPRPERSPAPVTVRQSLEAGAESVSKAGSASGKSAALDKVFTGSDETKPASAVEPVPGKAAAIGSFRPVFSAAAPAAGTEADGPQAPSIESSPFITHTPTAVGYLKAMLQSRSLGHYTMLVGEAGTGKNALIYELSRLLRTKVKVLSLNEQTELRDLVVRTTLKNGETVLAPSALVEAMEGGFEVVLDEVDRAPAGVLAGLNHILQFGEVTLPDGRVIKAKKGFFVWATRNPPKPPYRGENLSGELEDRFSIMTVDYLPEAEEVQVLAGRAGNVPRQLITSLVQAANLLRAAYRKGLLPRPVTMRSLIRTIDRLKAYPGSAIWDAFKAGYNVGYLDEGLEDVVHKTLESLGLIGPMAGRTGVKKAPVSEEPLQAFQGHEFGGIESVALGADRRYLFTGADDATARMWDTMTGEEVRKFGLEAPGTLQKGRGEVNALALSPDGKTLFAAGWDKVIRMFDVKTGKESGTRFEGHSQTVDALAVSADGRHVFSASWDGTARMWDVDTGDEVRAFKGKGGAACKSLLLSPDGKRLFVGGFDGIVRAFDVATGAELQAFQGHEKAVVALSLSPDGRYLFTGSWDKTARMWEVASGVEVHKFEGHTKELRSLALSPDGRYLYTGSDDHLVRMWDIATGKFVWTFAGHDGGVKAMALSADGKRLFTGSWDKLARMWDVPSLEEDAADDLRARAELISNDISVKDGRLRIGDLEAPTPLSSIGSSTFITHTPTAVGYLKSMLQSRLLGHFTMLVGEAGTGKNALIYELARLLGSKVKVLSLNEQTELRDLVVRTTLKNGETVLAPSALVEAMEGGFEVVLDEVDRAPAGVLAGLNHILQFGEVTLPDGRVIKAKKGFFVWATRNPPKAPYRGEHLSGELEDRFSVMTVDYLPEAEEVQVLAARAGNLPTDLVMGLVKAANQLRASYRKGLLPRPVTMRSLIRAIDRLKAYPHMPVWEAFKAGYNVSYLEEGLEAVVHKVVDVFIGPMEGRAEPSADAAPAAETVSLEKGSLRIGDLEAPTPLSSIGSSTFITHTPTAVGYLKSMLQSRLLGHFTMLVGEAGTGKNALIYELSRLLGSKVKVLSLNEQTELRDLVVRTTLKNGETVLAPSALVEAMEGGFEVVLDEVDRAPAGVLAGLNHILQFGEVTLPDGRVIKAKKGFFVWATRNPPKAPYRGEHLSGELEDRFSVMTVDYLPEAEEVQVLSERARDVPSPLITSLVKAANELRSLYLQGLLPRPVTMRSLIRTIDRLKAYPETPFWDAFKAGYNVGYLDEGFDDLIHKVLEKLGLVAARPQPGARAETPSEAPQASDISIKDGVLRIGDTAMPLAANLEAPPTAGRAPAAQDAQVPAALVRLLEGLARMLTHEPGLRMAPWQSMSPGDRRTWRMIFEKLELQFLPEDLSDPDQDIPTAMTMHELWHLLETHPELIEAAHQDRPFLSLWNAVEDTRVNTLGRERHPGSRHWLEKLYRKLYGVRDLEAEKATMGRVPLHLQFGYGLIYRWWKGMDDPRVSDPRVLEALKRAKADIEKAGSTPDAAESYRIIRDKIWPVYKQLLEEAKKQEMDQQLADQAAEESPSELQPSDKDSQGQPKPLDQLSQEAREKLEQKIKEKLENMTPEQRKELERKASEEISRQEEKFNEEHGSKLLPKDKAGQEKLEKLREKASDAERLGKAEDEAKDALEAERQAKTGVSGVEEVGFYGYRSRVVAGIATLRAKWQMLFQHKTRKRDMRGRTSGELDEGRLAEAMAGDEAVFRRKLKPGKFAVQISLLVDLSGSMKEAEKYKRAIEGAVLVMESLRDIPGIEVEIVGYKAGTPALVLKEFHEPYSLAKAVKIVQRLEREFNGMNGDNYGLAAAIKRIRARPAAKKIVIMSSDGDPDGLVDREEFARQIHEARDVFVFGLGIGPEAKIVRELFPEGRSVWAEDPAQTAEGIFRILDSHLEN